LANHIHESVSTATRHDNLNDAQEGARKWTPQPVEPVTYTVDAATRAFGIGRSTLFSLMAGGKLARVKIGKRTLITAESLRALISAGAE
jgi:hypothetical protein